MINARRSILALAAAVALGSATAAFSDDWPQWRGPNRDGKVTGFTPPATWPKELAQKWKVTVGDGVATPALVGDRLYVFTRQDADEVLTCINATNGQEIWKKSYPTAAVGGAARDFPGPRSSPAVADGKVLTLGVAGILTCWDANDGEILWKKTEIKGFPGFYTASSPAIVDGLAVAQLGGRGAGGMGGGGGRGRGGFGGPGGQGGQGGQGGGQGGARGEGGQPQREAGPAAREGAAREGVAAREAGQGAGGAGTGGIIAFDLSSGNERWKWMDAAPTYGSPVVATIAGVKQIVAPTERSVAGVSVADGKMLWQISSPPQRMTYNAPSPIVDGDTVILTGFGGGTRAVKISKEGDKFSTSDAWNNPDLGTTFNTPVLKDGFLYGLSSQGALFCINAKDGTTAWTGPQMGGGGGQRGGGGAGGQQRPGGADAAGGAGGAGGGGQRGPGGFGGRGGGGGRNNFGAIVDAGSVLIALPANAELIVFKPNSKAYEEVARIKVANPPTYAHPILAGNKVFVKDQNSLALLAFE